MRFLKADVQIFTYVCTIWTQTKRMEKKKTRREEGNNAQCVSEQTLKSAPLKTAVASSLTSHIKTIKQEELDM